MKAVVKYLFAALAAATMLPMLAGCVTENVVKVSLEKPKINKTGDPVNLRLKTLEGKPVNLSRFRGKVVLVDIFATWCNPCLKTTPMYVELHEQFKDKGFTVVGIGMDEGGAVLLYPYISFFKIPYPVFLPSRELLEGRSPLGELTVLPYAILLDRTGAILDSFAGLSDRERLVKAVVNAVED